MLTSNLEILIYQSKDDELIAFGWDWRYGINSAFKFSTSKDNFQSRLLKKRLNNCTKCSNKNAVLKALVCMRVLGNLHSNVLYRFAWHSYQSEHYGACKPLSVKTNICVIEKETQIYFICHFPFVKWASNHQFYKIGYLDLSFVYCRDQSSFSLKIIRLSSNFTITISVFELTINHGIYMRLIRTAFLLMTRFPVLSVLFDLELLDSIWYPKHPHLAKQPSIHLFQNLLYNKTRKKCN